MRYLLLEDNPVRTPQIIADTVSENSSMYRKENWEIVRNFEEFRQWILNNGLPDVVSFDHDLADVHHFKEDKRLIVPPDEVQFDYDEYKEEEKTGLHCAKWLTEFCTHEYLPLPTCYVHSQNTVGKNNIESYLRNYKKHEQSILLYRPVGPAEMDKILDSRCKRFPPRLPEQPIFYPVMNEEYASEISQKWNVPAYGVGYVVKFYVDKKYVSKFPIQNVGGEIHNELWVPAEELEEFNNHIFGDIEIVKVFSNI